MIVAKRVAKRVIVAKRVLIGMIERVGDRSKACINRHNNSKACINRIKRVGDRSKACINRHDRTCW